MADSTLDFAVIGSGPLCLLLAGLLAGTHGRSTVLVGDRPSPFLLRRGLSLSAAPLTNPQTWAMLRAVVPETLRILRTLGAGSFERIDPLLVAHSDASRTLLSHIRHIASGFGIAAERETRGGIEACRLRDSALIDPVRLAELAAPWLAGSGVAWLPARNAEVTLRRDGGVRIRSGETSLEAAQAVLADDDSLLAHFGDLLEGAIFTSILTEPAARLRAPLQHHLDSGVTLLQHGAGQITAIAPGEADSAAATTAAALAGQMRRAGEVSYRILATADGGPLFGALRPSRVIAIGGFGAIAPFLAPAIARVLAGAASEPEAAYFSARSPGKGRGAAADIGPRPMAVAA